MNYPKQVMSITELTKIGLSRDYLNKLTHHKDSRRYAWRTSGGGKWLFDVAELEKHMKGKR